MVRDVLLHRALRRELPAGAQAQLRETVRGLAELGSSLEHPHVVPMHGARVPRSFRLRIGAYRVLGVDLPDEGLVILTAAFRKRRAADYRRAVERHEQRVAEAGAYSG